jgi:DNA modification methylase
MKEAKLNIQTRKISELIPSEYNPRVMDKKAKDKLKKNMEEEGYLQSIVINNYPGRENIIISGHQRYDILKEDGYETVDVTVVNVPPEKEKALNLWFNKFRGEWKEDKLIEVLEAINTNAEDLLIKTGFEDNEIAYLLGLKKLQEEKIYAIGVEDYAKGKESNLKQGTIVTIDKKHKIIIGDSSRPETWRKLLGESKVDLLITSPPYDRETKEIREYFKTMSNVFKNSKEYMNAGRYIAINIGYEAGPLFLPGQYNEILREIGFDYFRMIYWMKQEGPSMVRNPFPRYYVPKINGEQILIYSNEELDNLHAWITFKKGDEKDRAKKEKIPEILLSKYRTNVWKMNPETRLSAEHPATFPIQLPFNFIRFFTFEGEKVIDPFLGSGTSIIAADQLNRIGYGIEIDPAYVDVAIRRYKLYKPEAKIEIK